MPERLGRYEIVERLSAGGMGEVFVARFIAPGGFVKPVALKRIHPHLAGNDQFIQMLHDEANVTASLRHPNIVATVDVGSEGDDHYVVLDYVSGDPLSRLVREMKQRQLAMPAYAVAWIGAEIASALHAAHEARSLTGEALEIVHRDVSLGNVMLSDAGHAMLFDFGVAKARQKIHQTAHGELKGKLIYMAPEVFRGAPVDRTVDVFSLGVVLYELLTNVSPFFRDSDIEIITALQSAVVPPPSQVNPSIDPALDPIVMTAMARDRAYRYATAAQVEEALRAWARASGAPHDAAPVAAWYGATFPHRLHARRGVLARVADLTRRPQQGGLGATGGGLQALGSSSPSWPGAGAAGTPPPGSWPGGAQQPGSGPRSWPGAAPAPMMQGGTAVMPLSRPDAASVSNVASSVTYGAAAPAAAPSRAPWIAVTAVALAAVAVLAILLLRGGPRAAAHDSAMADSAASSSSAPVAAAPPTASAVASAAPSVAEVEPSATASAAAIAPRNVPVRKAPSKAADTAAGKSKGPIVRTYE